MKAYSVRVGWSDENGGFVAAIPDLPGCEAFGATPELALAGLERAAAEWLAAARAHGLPIPEPRDLPDAEPAEVELSAFV